MGDWLPPEVSFILYWLYSLLYSWSTVNIFSVCHNVLCPFFYGTNFNLKHSEFIFGCLLSNHKKKWFLILSSMYIDRYCATESLSSLVKQHIPGATLLQQNDQQLVYSLPFKDMDKFSGITYLQFLGLWTRIDPNLVRSKVKLGLNYRAGLFLCYISGWFHFRAFVSELRIIFCTKLIQILMVICVSWIMVSHRNYLFTL